MYRKMTIEEAIDIMKEVKELDDSIYQYNTTYRKALDMLIEAVEQKPKWMPYQEIISTIKEEMKRRELTVQDLAEMTGYYHNSIGNWLRFDNIAKYTAVEDMVTALGFHLILMIKEDEDV